MDAVDGTPRAPSGDVVAIAGGSHGAGARLVTEVANGPGALSCHEKTMQRTALLGRLARVGTPTSLSVGGLSGFDLKRIAVDHVDRPSWLVSKLFVSDIAYHVAGGMNLPKSADDVGGDVHNETQVGVQLMHPLRRG